MAEQKEELIIEINVTKSIEQLGVMRQSLDELIAQREELSEKSKAGDLASTKALEMLNSTIRNQQLEYKATQRVLDGYVQSKKKEADTINFANNSINQNKALLKQLTAQYNDLKNPSKEATEKIRTLSDALKQQESAVGNNTRNVGNYKEALTGAFKELKGFGAVIDPIKNMGLAFETAGGGVKGFGVALLATGLPIFIMAMNSLIDVFKSFKPIAEGVENVMTGLSTAFKAIVSGGDIGKMVEANQALLDVMRDLEDTQGAFNIMQEKSNTEIQRLIVSSKDRTKSDKERLALLKQANDLEKKMFDEGKQRVDDEVRARAKKLIEDNKISQQEYQLLVYGTNQQSLELQKRLSATASFSEKELKLLQDKIKERSTLEGQSSLLQEKLANRTNQLQDDMVAEQQKILEKQKKIAEERRKLYIERIAMEVKLAQNILLMDKSIQEAKDAKAKKEKEDFDAETKRLIDAEVKQAQIRAKRIGSVEAQVDAEIMARHALLDNEKLNSVERENIIMESEDRIKEIKKKSGEEQLALQKKQTKDATTIVSALATQSIQVLSEIGSILEADIKEKQTNLDEALANGSISQKKYAEESRKLKKKQFEETKAIALVSAIMQGVNAVISAYNSGVAIPVVGAVTGPIFAGLAGAFSAIQIGMIANQQPPSNFAKGVIGLDGDGTETSDSIPARLSKGESVITAKATKQFHRELAWMEQMVGNKPNYQFGQGNFANGIIGDGGYVARDTVKNADQSLIMSEAIRQGFKDIPVPTLSIVEFQNKVNSRNRSINISEA